MNDDFNKNEFPCSLSFKKGGARGGFTLIEVVVSMAIFTLIIGGVVMFSVNAIKASTKSQAMQETMDNARYAIDNLAKKVRSSSNVVVTDEGKSLFFIDNLTVTKYCYKFILGDDGLSKMKMMSMKLEVGGAQNLILNRNEYNNVTGCDSVSGFSDTLHGGGGAPVDLIGSDKADISGTFDVLRTDVSSNNPHRGFVRINVDIVYKGGINSGDPADSAEAHIQTGVSILDYTREGNVEF